jgi:hypothetical protein
MFLDKPKVRKIRKKMTARVVTKEDIELVLAIAQLRVEQFKDALKLEKPVVHVESAQGKIRMEHYVPLHPQLAGVLEILCDSKGNSERMFILESFRKWLQKQRTLLARCNAHFVTSDLRKFAEQQGDIVRWDESNRAYVLTHGVRGIECVIIDTCCPNTFLASI